MRHWGGFVGLIVLLVGIAAAGGLQAQIAGAAFPDLTIDKILLDKDCLVTVVVKNLGPGKIPDTVWTVHTPQSAGVYLYRNGSNWGGETIWLFDPTKQLQNPGGTATFVSNLKVTGTESIKATVDLWDAVKEANEKNNSLEVKRTCQAQADKCCVAGTYKGMHHDTASATCPTPKIEEFKFELHQVNCGPSVTGTVQTLKSGVWTAVHSFRGTITAQKKCCLLQGELTELTTGQKGTISGHLCYSNGKWSVSDGANSGPGGCSGTFKMDQI